MPSSNPDFGGLRTIKFEEGYIVWVACPGEGVPEWITPVMRHAYHFIEATLILFDCDCNTMPPYPTWDWGYKE